MTDVVIRLIPIDQTRKSTTSVSLTTDDMIELEERFDKWMNNPMTKLVDDLFDGLKVVS